MAIETREELDGVSYVLRPADDAAMNARIFDVLLPGMLQLGVLTGMSGFALSVAAGGGIPWIEAMMVLGIMGSTLTGVMAVIASLNGVAGLLAVPRYLARPLNAMGAGDLAVAGLVVAAQWGYLAATGGALGKVVTGALGGALAWWLGYEVVRRAWLHSSRWEVQLRSGAVYVRRRVGSWTGRPWIVARGELDPDVVGTPHGLALQVRPGVVLPADAHSFRELTDVFVKLHSRRQGDDGSDDVPAALQTVSPKRGLGRVPGARFYAVLTGLLVSAVVAGLAYPLCWVMGWSIYAVGGIAISGGVLSLGPIFRGS